MKKRLILKVLGLLLLLPMFSGCNDTDDVAGIFTGKTWKLTYITKANGHGWYNFPDIADESNVMEYINGKKTFMLVFSGSVEDDIIQGTFTGSGAINTNGTWSANGKNQEFGMKVEKGTPIDSKDRIAEKILEGMRKANSYKGSDSRNLYLYYQTDKEDLCLVFSSKLRLELKQDGHGKETIGTGQTLHTYGKHMGGKLLLPAS